MLTSIFAPLFAIALLPIAFIPVVAKVAWRRRQHRITLRRRNVAAATRLSAITQELPVVTAVPQELLMLPTSPPALTPQDLRLRTIAFPALSEDQFSALLRQARPEDLAPGAMIDNRLRVSVITDGNVRLSRADGHYLYLGVGSLLGEIGWAAPDRPGKEMVVVKSVDGVCLLRWSQAELESLRDSDPKLYAAVWQSVARDLAIKLSLPMQKCRVPEDAKALAAEESQ